MVLWARLLHAGFTDYRPRKIIIGNDHAFGDESAVDRLRKRRPTQIAIKSFEQDGEIDFAADILESCQPMMATATAIQLAKAVETDGWPLARQLAWPLAMGSASSTADNRSCLPVTMPLMHRRNNPTGAVQSPTVCDPFISEKVDVQIVHQCRTDAAANCDPVWRQASADGGTPWRRHVNFGDKFEDFSASATPLWLDRRPALMTMALSISWKA